MFSDVEDWHYCPMYGSRKINNCNFYAGNVPVIISRLIDYSVCITAVGASKVYRLQRRKWVKVKNVQLVRGTLLYGELVKECNVFKKDVNVNPDGRGFKYSLHVVDALRLGEKSLSDLKFKER